MPTTETERAEAPPVLETAPVELALAEEAPEVPVALLDGAVYVPLLEPDPDPEVPVEPAATLARVVAAEPEAAATPLPDPWEGEMAPPAEAILDAAAVATVPLPVALELLEVEVTFEQERS